MTTFLAIGTAMTSGARPWMDALGGAFTPPDFAQDVAAARLVTRGISPYGPEFGAEHAEVFGGEPRALGSNGPIGYPYFPHPPFVVVLSWPFAYLPFEAAALAWFAGSMALLFMMAFLLGEVTSSAIGSAPQGRPATGTGVTIFLCLLLWPPVLYNLEKGQFSIILAVLLALAWRLCAHGAFGAGATLVGIAASIKLFPLVFVWYFLSRSLRAAIALVVTAMLLTGLSVVLLGPGTFEAFLRNSYDNVKYWETWTAVTYSVHGALTRAFIGGHWAEPFVHAPALTRGAVALSAVILSLAALKATYGRSWLDRNEGARFAAWSTAALALNPLAMGHNGVLLALPIVLVAQGLRDDARLWPRVAWSLAVILVSIPRQTTFRLSPPPVGPWEGLGVVALPLWGIVLLFVAALSTTGSKHSH